MAATHRLLNQVKTFIFGGKNNGVPTHQENRTAKGKEGPQKVVLRECAGEMAKQCTNAGSSTAAHSNRNLRGPAAVTRQRETVHSSTNSSSDLYYGGLFVTEERIVHKAFGTVSYGAENTTGKQDHRNEDKNNTALHTGDSTGHANNRIEHQCNKTGQKNDKTEHQSNTTVHVNHRTEHQNNITESTHNRTEHKADIRQNQPQEKDNIVLFVEKLDGRVKSTNSKTEAVNMYIGPSKEASDPPVYAHNICRVPGLKRKPGLLITPQNTKKPSVLSDITNKHHIISAHPSHMKTFIRHKPSNTSPNSAASKCHSSLSGAANKHLSVSSHNRTSPTSSSMQTPQLVSGDRAGGGRGTTYKRTPPLCRCGRRARLLQAYKPGPNQGRSFFSCSRSSTTLNGCQFFQWEDQVVSPLISPLYTPKQRSGSVLEAQSLPCHKRKPVLGMVPRPHTEPRNRASHPYIVRSNVVTPRQPVLGGHGNNTTTLMKPWGGQDSEQVEITPYIIRPKLKCSN